MANKMPGWIRITHTRIDDKTNTITIYFAINKWHPSFWLLIIRAAMRDLRQWWAG